MALDTKELREYYTETLLEFAEKDDRLVIVEADLAKSAKTIYFKEKFPERFIDVGVAEANMIAVAAGLSAFGKIPFTHSFATFATRRCFDQVFISIAYAGLNVKMCGSDPGVAAELNGGTHMSLEDIGLMRVVPNMVIFEPVDAIQLKKAIPQIIEHYGPVYIRLFRRKAEIIYDNNYNFKLGKADTIVEGRDATIFATGLMVKNSLDAADMLKKQGINVRVVNIHTIKPIDKEAVIKAARETGAVVTAENHNIINGLGSAVAEVLSENMPVPVKRIGARDHFGEVAKKEALMKKFKLMPTDIADAVKSVIAKKIDGGGV